MPIGIRPLPPIWVLAIIVFFESCWNALLPPDFVTGPLGMFQKLGISIRKICVNSHFAFIDRFIVAVVNDRSCHPTKNGFDNVQKLSVCWKRHQFDQRCIVNRSKEITIYPLDFLIKRLRVGPSDS